MPLWSNTDANTSVPKFAPLQLKVSATQNNSNLAFGNTTISAFIPNEVDGIFGYDTTEQQNAASNSVATLTSGHPAHAGWILRKVGTGPVATISISNAGAMSNIGNAYVTFSSGGAGSVAANAQIFVNTVSNVVQSIVLNSGGTYAFTPTATISGNANVTISLTMGGRANRVQTETLVAIASITGDGDGTTIW